MTDDRKVLGSDRWFAIYEQQQEELLQRLRQGGGGGTSDGGMQDRVTRLETHF